MQRVKHALAFAIGRSRLWLFLPAQPIAEGAACLASGTLASTDCQRRMLIDVVAEAASAPTPQAFESAILQRLSKSVGMDAAFFACTCRSTPPTTLGINPALLSCTASHAYVRELEPVKQAALQNHGVAVDTDVLGRDRVCRSRYHRDIASPMGGTHSLMAYLTLRGRHFGALMLGRCGRGFRDRDLHTVATILPALSLAGASFGCERQAPHLSCLTPRERDVLDYLCLGYTNREIALAIGNSPHTVRNQLVSVFGKIGASTRSEAVAIARA